MKNKKLLLVIGSVFVITILAFGLWSFLKNQKTITIGLILSNEKSSFCKSLKTEIENKAKLKKINLVIKDAKDSSSEFSKGLNALVNQKVDLIIVNPVNATSNKADLENISNSKIPIISVGTKVDAKNVISNIYFDNYNGGKQAGEYMSSILPPKARVLILRGITQSSITWDRENGFKEGIKGKLKLIAALKGDFMKHLAVKETKAAMKQYKDIQGIFAENDEMATGAVQALESLKIKNIKVVGFECNEEGRGFIKEKRMDSSFALNNTILGTNAFETAMDYLSKKSVKKDVLASYELVK